jgi:PAS domain S-box-containing protein
MDSINKTREELIKELQELQQAHNSLKATIETDLLSHKLTEDALRASEERFQLLFNKAPLGYQSLDYDGNFIEVNQQWLDTLGYERDEVIGKWFGDFLTPAFQDGFRNRFPVFKAQGHIHSEFEMVHKNGTVLFIAFDGRIGYDSNGEFKQTHCILQDITERKKAEQELKRIEWLLTSSPQVPEAQKQAYIPPYGDLVKLNTCRLILDSVGEPILTDIVGDYLNLLDTSSAIYEKNGDYALGIFSSGWCRFMDAASRAICDTNDNRMALDCGRWHCHESCWSRASKTAIETGQPTDIECDGGIRLYALPIRVDDEIVGAINFGYGEPPRDEKKLRELATNYKVSYEELRDHAMKYESRPPYIVDLAKQRLMASARMIGEIIKRKQAEEALRKSEENLSITLHSIGDGVISTDINGLIVNMNPIAEKLCGWKITDALGKPLHEVFKIIHAETRNTVADPVKKVLENGEIVGLANHTILISQNGTEYQIADSAAPIKNKEGKISGVVLVFSNITEKYLAEEELREREKRYRSLFSEMMEGFALHEIICDNCGNPVDYRFLEINPAFERLTGLNAKEVLGKSILEVMPETEKYWIETYGKVALTGTPEVFENYSKELNKYYKVSAFCNKKNQFVTVFEDITERKQAEETLKRTKQLLSDSEQLGKVGGWEFNIDTLKLNWTEETFRIHEVDFNYDYTVENGINFYTPDSKPIIENAVQRAIEFNEPFDLELKIITAKGNLRHVHTIGKIDVANRRIFGFFQDITERKLAEEFLKNSEAKFRSTFDQSPVGSVIVGINKRFIRCNKAFCNFIGYSEDELIEKTISEITFPDDVEMGIKEMKELVEGKTKQASFQKRYLRKDGTIVWGEISICLVSDENNIPLYFIPIIQDITERRKAEEALRKSEEMMLNSQSVAHICSYSTNLNVNELDKSVWVCSPEFYRIFGIDETYPHTIAGWAGFIHPDHREELVAYHEYVVKNRISFNHEYKIIRINDGAERWVQGTGELVYDEHGNPVRMHGAIQDITERKLAEDALQKSEAIKNKMVSNIGDVIVIIDKDGINRYKSPNIEKWFGWKPEDVVGKSTWENVHPEDLETCQKFLQSIAGEPNACGTTELRYRNKDGSYCPIEITVVNLLQDPNIRGFLGNYHNISERKKIEQELISAKEKAEENEEKFRSIVKSSPSAIYLYHLENDNRLVLTDANPSAEKIIGISHKALIGKPLEEAFPNLAQTEIPEMYRKIARRQIDNQSFEIPYTDERFTGYYSVKVYATQTNSIAVDFIDISERKKLEFDLIAAKEKAEESEQNIRKHKAEIEFHSERLESLLRISQYNTNSIQELLDFALDEAIKLTASKIGYIYFYNEEKSQFFLNTWSKDMMRECNVLSPQTTYDLDKTGCWGEAVRQRKPIIINDFQAENPQRKGIPEEHVQISKFLTIPVIFDNKIVAIAGLANKQTNYDNDDVRQLTLLMDNVWKISERILLIENLKVAKEKAEESDRLKTAFLQNMSHEIRTPMNAIMGFSELLVKHYNNKPKLEKFSDIINQRCNDLLDIINDILDIAKIESGQLTVIQEECNLNVLFDELKTFFTEQQKKIGKQHLKFDLQAFCEPSDTIVVTDKVKLKQIFINLISNAFKFTETGKIEGGCKFDENKNLLFFVADTGIGIPFDKHQMIFERFAQVEHGSNRLYGGTGLGLSIVKGLVNLLGGEIFLESEIDKGSTFSFVIPIKSQEIQPETKISEEPQE